MAYKTKTRKPKGTAKTIVIKEDGYISPAARKMFEESQKKKSNKK